MCLENVLFHLAVNNIDRKPVIVIARYIKKAISAGKALANAKAPATNAKKILLNVILSFSATFTNKETRELGPKVDYLLFTIFATSTRNPSRTLILENAFSKAIISSSFLGGR